MEPEPGTSQTRRSTPEQPSGHNDPKQRLIYLVLLSFSLLSALGGLLLLLVWVYYYRPRTGIGLSSAAGLTNLHPIMMYTFMVSLNMYAVLVYRTHYSSPKQQLKWTHAILSGVNIVMSVLGVFAMLKSHWMQDMPNFYSLHSWIGAATNLFYLAQFLTGFLAFLRPGIPLHQRKSMMPWHRLAGSMILVLAALAAITGIAEFVIFQDKDGAYSKFTPITYIANMAAVFIILMTAVSMYLLTEHKYRRPDLVEEQPLKSSKESA